MDISSSSPWFLKKEDGILPPGFRFHPEDEELITHYLLKKVLDADFSCRAIAEVDLNKSEPWELPEKAKLGEKEWYFFTLRDRKYPTGLRTNRATEAGYWKTTGKDREIYSSKSCSLLGMKKTLVFYKGRAPKGEKTEWLMHEFRLHGKFSYHYFSNRSRDEWVISRVFLKTGNSGGGSKKTRLPSSSVNFNGEPPSSPSSVSLPALLDSSSTGSACSYTTNTNTNINTEHVSCFSYTAANPTAAVFSFPPPAPMLTHAGDVDLNFTSYTGGDVHNFYHQSLHNLSFLCDSVLPTPPLYAAFHGGAVGNWPPITDESGRSCVWRN